MQPKTKLEHIVFSISKELPALTAEQKQWGLTYALPHLAYRTKTNTSCMDCGNIWKEPTNQDSCICPECGLKLKVETTLNKTLKQRKFFTIIDVRGEYQIIRHFEIKSFHKAGTKFTSSIREVIQQFINPDIKVQIVSRNRGHMGSFSDGFHGDLSIKKFYSKDSYTNDYKYDIWPDAVYPEVEILDIYKRNGITNKFGDVSPLEMFQNVVSDAKFETLLKANQMDILWARTASKRAELIDKYWHSIKICIRNNYIVKDAITWFDYIELLELFGKDLRSHFYVCPADLDAEHNRLVAKKAAMTSREVDIMTAQKEQSHYKKLRGAYFGIAFGKGAITVKVLQSVLEFMEAGEKLKHCVFTKEYYKKSDCLILGAYKDGKLLECVEVSLAKMTVIQSRGVQNQPTKYNNQIVEMVEKNILTIQKTYKQKIAA